jgi:molecular chaperone DnaK
VSKTVEWGIDLGTTNSAIARMTTKGAEVVQVQRQNYIPSAVAVDKRGDVKVGADALNVHLGGARWFKRLMGTKNVASMGGEAWTPERLSSEILKALRAAARRRSNEEIEDVVITVPAMFTQPQCAATNEAARMAGLNAVALLQEPIAAATAYLTDNAAEGNYLVYDLGGGTFDVSLIRLAGGEMNVVEHGGDNYLGGADFDRAIFDWVLNQIDRKGGDTRLFEGGWQRAQLLLACEEARVLVSDSETAPIYLDDFELHVSKIELSRECAEDLISNLVTRTIEISQDRIKAVGGSVRSVLLVGGPTQMPYVRRRLQTELGVALAFDQDPMTVVAEGAALHAGTLLRHQDKGTVQSQAGSASLELYFEPVCPDETTTVAGKIVRPTGLVGEVRLKSTDGVWESGWRTLINGAFSLEVILGRQQLTEYEVELRDLQGRSISCSPSSLTIRSGVRSAQPVTPYNYGVVRQGGKLGVVVKAGEPLPASGSDDFALAKTVVAGSPDEAIIYFVEGSSSFPDENVRVGSLTIRGTEIRRTLKEGEKVQVRIRMDESRRLTAKVHIPLIDEDYIVDLHSVQDAPDLDDLISSFREAREAINEVENHADDGEQETVVRAERQLEQLEATLVRVERGEVGEAERVQKQLADVKATLRPLRDKYGLQAKYDDVVEVIVDAEGLCKHYNDQMGLAKLIDARNDAEKALRLEQVKALESIRDRVTDIFWEHYGKTRECWEHQVELIKIRAPMAKDPLTYYEHVRRAEQALSESDYEGVRLNALRAWELLPETVKGNDRFHDAALR